MCGGSRNCSTPVEDLLLTGPVPSMAQESEGASPEEEEEESTQPARQD